MNPQQAYEYVLLALCVWREARGESDVNAKLGVAWVIRNRVQQPRWWGTSWVSVILKPWQFSSFNAKDPNAVKWPAVADPAWAECMAAATEAYSGTEPDPTGGATHYYDKSLDANSPAWAKDGSLVHVCDIGSLRFWK